MTTPTPVYDAVRAMAEAPTSPDAVTAAQRAIWSGRGDRLRREIDVPACPYSSDELVSLAAAGRKVAYLPDELATQDGRAQLGTLFPAMQCYSVHPDNVVTNDGDAAGWFDYHADIDAEYLDTDERGLLEQLARDGRTLLTLNQYIVASQDRSLMSGRNLDERRTWARIGARVDGRMVAARFDGHEMAIGLGDETPTAGSLLVGYDLGAADRGLLLGARATSLHAPGRHLVAATSPARLRLDPLPVTPLTAADLVAEWDRQADAYVALGYPAALRMSAEVYRASLPRFAAQPSGYSGRFDVPVVVETRIGWLEQAERAGISVPPGTRAVTFASTSAAAELRPAPYSAWFNAWGHRFPDPIAPAGARAQLAGDEVGANLVELVAMEITHREANQRGRFYEAIGDVMSTGGPTGLSTPMDAGRTPGMYRWRHRPEIGCNLHPTEYSLFRPLVRGTATS